MTSALPKSDKKVNFIQESANFLRQELWNFCVYGEFTDLVLLPRDGRLNIHSALLVHLVQPVKHLISAQFQLGEQVLISMPNSTLDELKCALELLYLKHDASQLKTLLGCDVKQTNKTTNRLPKVELNSSTLVNVKEESDNSESKCELIDNNALVSCYYSGKAGVEKTEFREALKQEIEMSICHLTRGQSMQKSSIFKRKEDLHTNVKSCQVKKMFQCEECGKKISSQYQLKKHIEAMHQGKMFFCPHCPYKIGWKKSLKEHLVLYHSSAPLKYQCSKCGKNFKRKGAMDEHELTHNSKDIACDQCDKKFSSERYLTRHVESVHGESKHSCSECHKKFTTNAYLKDHIRRSHTPHSKRRHTCDVCGQGFSAKGAYRGHMNKHLGVRSYKCPGNDCVKEFYDSSSLCHHKKNCVSLIRPS